ncbi:Outer membrane protein TolC [Hymenobacter arizonensis]|uniref:Outer membrane protein TolC n=1 Tax=Hymenobacter arizonensis TaxID=1227077 RepID=A0A1I5SZN7_HYMAR|nr:Outer membrane protein TolC [Hymenobacter arizonensis]
MSKLNQVLKSVLRPIALVLALAGPLCAQTSPAAGDSAVFGLNDFYRFVTERHPVARQAGLLPERAQQEVRQARGAFDPRAESKFYGKEFDGKSYFYDWDNALRVPIWLGGIDLRAGYERGVGTYVNPQEFTSPAGLSYVGISVPLGQGFLIDERRAALRIAQAMVGLAEAERRAALNKLILTATKDYWEWSLSYQRYQLLRNNRDLGRVRFEATRERVRQGDLAAIDSVEALTELQNRETQLAQALGQWQNATLMVSNYLWDQNSQPRELPATARPQLLPPPLTWRDYPRDSLQQNLGQAQEFHPDLLKTRAKLEGLGIERRLVRNKLLPKLSLDANLLHGGQPFSLESRSPSTYAGGYLANNYKVGFSFAQPLFLRQERGKLQVNALKIREAELGLEQDARFVQTAVQMNANEWQALVQQLRMQAQAVENYQRLRDGEQIRFENGESTVFLLNSREASLVNSRLKLAELQAKYGQVQAGRVFSLGGLL